VNWFDTAATYGDGQSEASLGEALSAIDAKQPLHVATKVRVRISKETDLRPLVVASVKESLARLRLPRISLLQIHNAITLRRNDQPTSITPDDVLGPQGMLAGMEEVRAVGLVDHFGLTGIGDAEALRTVMQSRRFATIQAPFHLLNPSALVETPAGLCDPDYGGFLRDAQALDMGIFAIRVFAAGALLGAKPSDHTLKTPFFPLPLYQRDLARAECLVKQLGTYDRLREWAFRYVLSLQPITSAILGFGTCEHVAQAVELAKHGPLSTEELTQLAAWQAVLGELTSR